MSPIWVLAILLVASFFIHYSSAHTIDAVETYRLEIGWIYEPAFSKETNGIELWISEMTPCPGLAPMLCASSQEFENGIGGLGGAIKIQLVYDADHITLPLREDHNVAGKYHAFVNPTVSGFYQVNLIGEINGTVLSLSMHPPKVNERQHIEFPESAELTTEQLIDGHTAVIDEISTIKGEMQRIEELAKADALDYAGIILGTAGLIVAGSALLLRTRRASGSAGTISDP